MSWKLPNKYKEVKKVKSKLWHEAVIECCNILIKRYEEDELYEGCPLCFSFMLNNDDLPRNKHNNCYNCPWLIYQKADHDCMSSTGFTDEDYPERIKRLKEWRRRSRIALTKLKKGKTNGE